MSPYTSVLKELRESQAVLSKVSHLLKVSVSKELQEKAKEALKDKKYKDSDSGREIAFSTAYSRGNEKAKKDYENAVKSVSKKKEEEDDDNPFDDLNEEQIDLLERVAQGRDVSDMSLVEERVLRESIAILLESQDELEKEGEPEPPKKAPPKKKRKYKKKVKKKVEEKAKEKVEEADDDLQFIDINELIDLDELSEIHSEDAKPLDKALGKTRRDSLEEQMPEKKVDRKKLEKRLEESVQNISTKAMSDLDDKINALKDELASASSQSKRDEIQDQIDDLEDQKEITELNIKGTQDGYRKALGQAIKDIPNLDDKQSEELAQAYSSMGADLVAMVEDPSKLNTYIEEQIDELSYLDEFADDYPEKLGKLMALKAMRDEVVNNPTFGFNPPRLNADPVFLEEYKREVGTQQRKKFNSFSEEQRELAAKKISLQKEDLLDTINSPDASPADKERAERELLIVRESEAALNSVRLLNGEEPLEGFSPVDKALLDLIEKSSGYGKSRSKSPSLKGLKGLDDDDDDEDEVRQGLFELVSNISRSDLSNEEMRQVVESGFKNLPQKEWEAVIFDVDSNSEFKEMFAENYCPLTPKNEAAGLAGQKSDKCPEPMSKQVLESVKDSLTKQYLDVHTAFKAQKKKKKTLPSRKSKDLAKMLKENKKEFLSIVIGGETLEGAKVSKKEKEEYMTYFFSELRALNLKSLKAQGLKINGIEDLMRRVNRIRNLTGEKRTEEINLLEKLISDLMDLNPPTKKAFIFNNPFMRNPNNCGGSPMNKKSTVYVNYQQRAKAFKRGMRVYTFWEGNSAQPGVVVAVYPSIGMVDVQYPNGSQRVPVEELIVDTSGDVEVLSDSDVNVPGGVGTTPVTTKLAKSIARKHMKKAIYWTEAGRQYRLCKGEDPSKPNCPKCKTPMGRTPYKRRDGRSERVFACRGCLFIIKADDVKGV
jgi:hypothetical protein